MRVAAPCESGHGRPPGGPWCAQSAPDWSTCSGYSPSGAETLFRTLSRLAGDPSTTATVVPLGCRGVILSLPREALAPLGNDGKAVTPVRSVVREPLAVVGDLDLGVRRVNGAGHPQIR